MKFGGKECFYPDTFTHWCEFVNPLDMKTIENIRGNSNSFTTEVTIPNALDLDPIEYTEEEKRRLDFSKAIFGG